MLAFFLDTDQLIAIGAFLSGLGSFLLGIVAIRLARKENKGEDSKPSDSGDGG